MSPNFFVACHCIWVPEKRVRNGGGGGCQFLNQYIHKHINIVSVKRNKHTVGSGGLFKGPPTQAPTLGINSSEWHLSGEKGELQLRQCYLFFKFSFFYPLEGTLKLQNLSHVWQMSSFYWVKLRLNEIKNKCYKIQGKFAKPLDQQIPPRTLQ